jgi:hypothetical protein
MYRKHLTVSERRCLGELLKNGHWKDVPQFHREMMSIARGAEVQLDGPGRRHYLFVMGKHPYCGTAGCSMLIGEVENNGTCHEIYADSGSEIGSTVLPLRDHGYRRLYTPCEVRFDGREYRSVREECPNIDVQR